MTTRIEPAEYSIRIYAPVADSTPYFVLRAEPSPARFLWSFRYRQAVNGLRQSPGTFTATLSADDELAGYLVRNALVEVRRRLPGERIWRQEAAYIVRYIEDEQPGDAHKLTVGGPEITWLAARQNIVPHVGATLDAEGFVALSDTADRVMKLLVNQQMSVSAPVNQQLPELIVTGFLPPVDQGAPVSVKGRYSETVLDLLYECYEQGALDFWFAFDRTADRIRFNTGSLGTDRTATNNPGGSFVVFSPARTNMLEPRYLDDWRDAVRIVDVLGAGRGADQEVETLPASLAALHRWDRVRRGVNAPKVEGGDATAFTTVARDALNKERPKQKFKFKAQQIPSCRYGRHYFLGDRVSVQHPRVEADYRIAVVEIWLSGAGETISVEFDLI